MTTVERRERAWDKETCVHAVVTRGLKVEMAAGVSWRHPEADPMVDAKVCVYCKRFLSLGDGFAPEPAKDTAETEVEVIAVEIALMTDEEREAKLNFEQCFAFGEGFDDTFVDAVANTFPGAVTYNSGEQAAWLAAQIIQHEVQGDPK